MTDNTLLEINEILNQPGLTHKERTFALRVKCGLNWDFIEEILPMPENGEFQPGDY